MKMSSGRSGYTLVELVIVVAIMALISGMVLLGRSGFQNSLALTNLTYDVALAARETQVYATNVREASRGSGNFNVGYGLHFKLGNYTNSLESSNQSFLMFADALIPSGVPDRRYCDNACKTGYGYSTSNVGEKVREFRLQNGNRISNLCVHVVSDNSMRCTNTNAISKLDVTFMRPDPEACISDGTPLGGAGGEFNSEDCPSDSGYDRAEITIQSPAGATRKVVITALGQISVQ